jgi:hypothetical protein
MAVSDFEMMLRIILLPLVVIICAVIAVAVGTIVIKVWTPKLQWKKRD